MTPTASPLPQLIVGPGSLGRLLAVSLADYAPVTLLGRRPPPPRLSLTAPDGTTRRRCITAITPSGLPPTFQGVVHLVTKAYAAEAALASIAGRLAPDTLLILWQNGYGIQQTLTRAWSGPVLCATTSEGAYIVEECAEEGGVVHAGHGMTYIGHLHGAYADQAIVIADLLKQAGLACQTVTDIRTRLWHKLAVNAAINPLVAHYRIRNGQLREQQFRPQVEALIGETAAIIEAEGIAPPNEGWHGRVWQVIDATANNRASMLQDVLAGRPTEREAILGPLLAAAAYHRLAAPNLEALNAALIDVP